MNNDAADSDPETLAGWGADPGIANLMVTPASTENLELEIVTGRDDPVLGFAPASRKKPIPVLNYRSRGDGPVTLAWVLTPYRQERPAIRATLDDRDDWTVVVVSHARGTNYIGVAARGQKQTLAAGSHPLTGHIAVVRRSKDGEIIAAQSE